MISSLFDDHYEAFPIWREGGLKGLTCLHIDAHLDVMAEGFTEESLLGIAKAKSKLELEKFRGNPRLQWGGFHCGNYLFPALKDGTVEELIWVLPPHVIGGETFVDGVRQEIQNWLDLRLDEYDGLRSEGGAVVGSLEGRRFVVCTAENLPKLKPHQVKNLVIDIDVDYFIRNSDDKVWQTPHQLSQILGPLKPLALTVAYSVDGGYTPLHERYLGRVVHDVFCGDERAWIEETGEMLRLDGLDLEERRNGLESFLKRAPDWLKPALLLRLDRAEEAQVLDPEYTIRFHNLVARHLVKKQHHLGLELLATSENDSAETHYLRSYLSLGKDDPLEAKRSLSKLLENGSLDAMERNRVLTLKANACLDLGEAKQALRLVDEVLQLEADSPEAHFLKFQCLKSLGELKKSARVIRKALRLAEGRVSSLRMMLSAARLYDELGQASLAKALRRELKEVDVTGRYAIKTMLDESKL